MTEQERIEDVKSVVATYFDVSVEDLASHRRTSRLQIPRIVAVYMSRQHSGAAPEDIGRAFGGRDRTIVEMYCRTIERERHKKQIGRLLSVLEGALRARQQLT
jgi:chromosomal replication initiator protein